jgi:ribosomal protein L24
MFCEQKTQQQMAQDSQQATKIALDHLKNEMNAVDFSNSTNTDGYDNESNEDPVNYIDSSDDQEEIILRKSGSKHRTNKSSHNSLIYMFTKYEKVQRKNRDYKTQIMKLETKIQKLEERLHFKNLDIVNIKSELGNEKLKFKEINDKYQKNIEYRFLGMGAGIALSLMYMYFSM